MRALYGGGGGPVHFREVPDATLDHPLAALVRPLAIALCDLDLAYIGGLVPTGQPYAIGHEFTGEVVAVGEAVNRLRPGDRVAVPFQISCGACDRCRAGRSLDCASVPPLSSFGLEPFGGGAWGGAAADLVRVPFADAMCVALPAGADPVALASLSDNVCDGYRCIAPYARPGDEAIVFGSASIGLYAVATAAALGVRCTYVDDHPDRLAVAQAFGARALDARPDGRSYGDFALSVAAVSTRRGLVSALRSTEPGGVCHSAGIHFLPVRIPLYELYRRGIHFVTGRANARDDMPAVLRLIASDRLPVAKITARVVDLDDAPEALAGPLPHKTVLRARA